MKKLLIMLLITLQMVCFFTACTESSASAPRVLEIQTETYSENTEWANHYYEITGTTTFTDDKVPAKKDFTFMDKTYSLNYTESRRYATSSTQSNYYNIPGIQYGFIAFRSNGKPWRIGNPDSICTVDGITENTPAEETARLVQEKLSPYIDFSQYPTLSHENLGYGFDLYWEHTVNGIVTSNIFVRLKNNGNITIIGFPPSKFEISDAEYEEALKKCPLETHESFLKAKLDKIYKTDKIEYNEDSWHIRDYALTSYEGKPAITYRISLEFRKKNTEQYWRELCNLLIVLE